MSVDFPHEIWKAFEKVREFWRAVKATVRGDIPTLDDREFGQRLLETYEGEKAFFAFRETDAYAALPDAVRARFAELVLEGRLYNPNEHRPPAPGPMRHVRRR